MPKHLLASMTWEEVNAAANEHRVVVVPVGAIEQHGFHLPIDMDNRGVMFVAEEAARRQPEVLLCAPPIHYGFNEHNMDFPGTVTIQIETLLNYAFEVGRSLALQGFTRIVWLNGHGSNGPVYDLVARKVTNRTSALSAAVNWWELAWPAIEEACEGLPESVDHAGEFETSVYLHLSPELVQMDRVVDEMVSAQDGPAWRFPNMSNQTPVHFMDWWSRMSNSGVNGKPSLATPEKGHAIVEFAIDALTGFAQEFKTMSVPPRVDHKISSRAD